MTNMKKFTLSKWGNRWKLWCPKCNTGGFIDDDQFHGKVSVICPNVECNFHETHDFSKMVEEKDA